MNPETAEGRTGGRGVRLLPNAVTVLALCSGLSGVQFMLAENRIAALACIALAAVFDALDGRLARLLDATSKMGAELDSLSDCVSFGVSPALILFLWSLHDIRIGWVVALVLVVSAALRLARFNTLSDDEEAPPYAGEFFVGVPSPAGALVALAPMALEVQLGPGFWSQPVVVAVWTIMVGTLMISRVPTASLKSVRVPPSLVAPLLVAVAFAAAALVTFPFVVYAVAVGAYLLHIPWAANRYRWLGRHPEVWHVPPRQRRAVRRAHRRLGLAPPRRNLRRRVAGAAQRAGSAARNIGRDRDRHGGDPTAPLPPPGPVERPTERRDRPVQRNGTGDDRRPRPRGSRRLGLRRHRDER
ncbi:CDP-diacylglycerol--serine O-phosphatidyltransferase [Actinomycetospora succinea]|uniref:CDP-diacylglycerol--serine O-phosphatidyltransferase n=1 Tax=Actinomycetospora succinea TaxID=663603 RepID=A0A4R6VLH8_9PSEU|nr:CDP-diacylglycerol--serine O-phosphatidyltransferase [Actinomycetospora succinea]TDQ62805.1 CDP-diacylglycerol--serine O-phosphatidyltransferase [Actinomycetospora succinea]